MPVSYKSPPSAGSGEVLAVHIIPEAVQSMLVDEVPAADKPDASRTTLNTAIEAEYFVQVGALPTPIAIELKVIATLD